MVPDGPSSRVPLAMASAALAPIVEMLRSVRPREGVPLDIAQLRMFLDSMVAPAPKGVSVQTFELAGRRAEWLVPEGADAGSRLLYLHGGAYVAGSPDTHRALAGRIARASGCVALIVDYRLAPENPFPAALDDALAALEHAAEHGPGGTTRAAHSLFVAGDSAGGGLTLSTMLAARGRLPVTAGVTLSAWTESRRHRRFLRHAPGGRPVPRSAPREARSRRLPRRP